MALVGSNGAGKSTLLKTLAGLLAPGAGTYRVLGQERGACFHRIAYLPQRSELDWDFPMSLRKLVVTGRYVHLGWFKSPGKEDWKKVDTIIEELGLQGLQDRQISELSGGQQQRTLLARCLIQESAILLLDEPLNAIDAQTVEIMDKVLARQKSLGKTVVTATHDVDRLENEFDGILFMNSGREIRPHHGNTSALKVGKEAFGVPL